MEGNVFGFWISIFIWFFVLNNFLLLKKGLMCFWCELFCGEGVEGGSVLYIGNGIDEEIGFGGELSGVGGGFGRIGIGCCEMEWVLWGNYFGWGYWKVIGGVVIILGIGFVVGFVDFFLVGGVFVFGVGIVDFLVVGFDVKR